MTAAGDAELPSRLYSILIDTLVVSAARVEQRGPPV